MNNTRTSANKQFNFIGKLNKNRIIDFYKRFLKRYPDGLIKKSEFDVINKKILITNQKVKQEDKNQINEDDLCKLMFDLCDTDSSGYIDFQEYLILFWARIQSVDAKEKLDFIFDLFDIDKNGYIDFYELHSIIKILFKLKNNTSNSYLNGYRLIKPVEETTKLTNYSYYITFDIMKKFDINRNGRLTKIEFVNGCMNHDDIHRFLIPIR